MYKIMICIGFIFLSSGCALTGNTGPLAMKCGKILEDGSREFELFLPAGSGRVYPAGSEDNPAIQTGDSHPCGAMKIHSIQQGEDRSPGIISFLVSLLMGG